MLNISLSVSLGKGMPFIWATSAGSLGKDNGRREGCVCAWPACPCFVSLSIPSDTGTYFFPILAYAEDRLRYSALQN